jgi:hypothetical protein
VLPAGLAAWKPNEVDCPAPTFALYDIAFAVTVDPLTVSVAFHEPVMVCPDGRVNVTVHPLIADAPAVTVTGCTTYPPLHWVCAVPTAPHAPVVGGLDVVGGADVGGRVVGGDEVGGLVVVGGGWVCPL